MLTYFCRGKHTFPPKSEKTDIQSRVLCLLVEYIKEKGDLFK